MRDKWGAGEVIQVGVDGTSTATRLWVTDHGIGIAPKDQKKIFERFERATNASESSGLGLGLFIVNQIVKAHGGQISLESELGHGSTFTIEFPLEYDALRKN